MSLDTVPDPGISEIDPQLCLKIVTECLDHLFDLIKSDGKFVYAHKFQNVSEAYSGYNLLRHCGTVWFMCKAINRLSLELTPDRAKLLSSSVLYVLKKLRPPEWNAGIAPGLCLPSRKSVKIGGGALCLLMLNEYQQLFLSRKIESVELNPSLSLETICTRLENYLRSEIRDGDFIHKRARETGEILPFRSEYYTGEVLFALISRGRSSGPSAELLSGLIDRDYGIAEQSHWMAYAASEALRQNLPQKEKTLQYLDRLMAQIIAESDYRQRQQSTPTACRTEALLAYLEVSQHMAGDRVKLREQSYQAVIENLKLQLAFYGNGQFKRGKDSDKVQIDYIQHNGASFLGLALLQGIDH